MSGLVAGAAYLRAASELDENDRRDLESYFEHLRAYYEIPADRPVFPARRLAATTRRRPLRTRHAAGGNGADHPWRNTL